MTDLTPHRRGPLYERAYASPVLLSSDDDDSTSLPSTPLDADNRRRRILGSRSSASRPVFVRAKKQKLDGSWLKASKEIHEYVTRNYNELGYFSVEIYENRAFTPYRYSSVLANDTIVHKWGAVKNTILHKIPLHDVVALECVRVGRGVSCLDNPPTVLVTVAKYWDGDWQAILDMLVETLYSFELHMVAAIITATPDE
ncbi:hypothetical protein AJ80_08574 [Polytolypa hystricis UAMH7299]|uniref:Uncharacterized protein n=1 Tax=Polytolypa hystricis (strain UAMH7299) TaxID=1447883 RepID=A0A2B7X5V5_POLH7|nr:hypothetical protein AJ80_08574 [Polytolypa hystricis UAMH7299]